MNRRTVVAAIVALLLAGGIGGWWFGRGAADDPGAALALSGNVDVHQVELAFRVGGRIESIAVDEGARVHAGDLIARLDAGPARDDQRLAAANVAQARAQLAKLTAGFRVEEVAQAHAAGDQRAADLANAESTRERLRDLAAQGMATRQQIDDADARVRESAAQLDSARQQIKLVTRGSRVEDLDAARAALAAAQAELAKTGTTVADTELRAPADGIVAVRAREPGAIVQAGQTVVTLALVDPVWIRAYVPQPRLGRIKPGAQVQIEVDSQPGRQYPGTVGFVSPEAEFTPKTVQTPEVRDDLVYRFRVVARDPDNVFRQGMPVTVRIARAR